MDRLTEKIYWEKNYTTVATEPPLVDALAGETAGFKRYLKKYLGEHLTDYSDYLLWDVVMKSCLPTDATMKTLEIGSAPGHNLLRLKETFGYQPYGVEYTATGARMNRQLFAQHGLDPAQVIVADAFSPDFLAQHRGTFDVVTSFGFVEHFDDVRTVIERQLDLLKEGGWLVVQIPRLVGLNYLIARCLNRETLQMHNLPIMQKEAFRQLFTGLPLDARFVDYVGTLKLILCLPHNQSGWLGRLTNSIKNLQVAMNLLLRALFRQKGAESYLFSPYLAFVGRKIASSPLPAPAAEKALSNR